MSRRRRDSDRVSHDRWLVSYADFITLLFAFFVVLFSSSQVDKRKAGKVSAAMQEAFQQMGIFPAANLTPPMVASRLQPVDNVQIVNRNTGSSGQQKSDTHLEAANVPPGIPKDFGTLQTDLAGALAPEIQRHEVVLKETHEGLVISLREIGFFESGSAKLRTTSQAAVKRIAQVLGAQTNNIRIEGHTDNVPIHNAEFPSNWELSTARATEIIQLFITQYGLAPTRLSAAGYAEYHPVAANDTTEGRTQNRRVDIIVLASIPKS